MGLALSVADEVVREHGGVAPKLHLGIEQVVTLHTDPASDLLRNWLVRRHALCQRTAVRILLAV